jgi:Nuclease-related domain
MAARRAGQHARQTTRRIALRYLVYLAALLTAGALALAAFGLRSAEFVLTELVLIAALLALDRFGTRVVDRWDRGATGEEEIGRLLRGLGDGWFTLHDIDTGRGNIDHVVIGPGGLFTIETKSHRGRISVDRIDLRMLGQAYAQRKWLERVSGHDVEALLVFSTAYLDRPVSRRRGVLVLPGRLLAGQLARRKHILAQEEVAAIHSRLARSVAGPGPS